jgi:Ni,Fe-hydrogenase III small subunit
MLRILKQALRCGIVTEAVPAHDAAALQALGIVIRRPIAACFAGSLAIRHVDAGSCNACELEVHALTNPYYDLERFGFYIVASPRHADALLVTGPVSRAMQTPLRRTWQAMPAPKYVIATGQCACDGGEFGVSYASCGAVDRVIPVDVLIPGCPPTPQALLVGLLAAVNSPALKI